MPILDALSVLASGATRGYRQGQEAKRQIAEARRRALLEERELATRESLAASQMALESSQARVQELLGQKYQEEATTERGARERGSLPISPSGTAGTRFEQLFGRGYTPTRQDITPEFMRLLESGEEAGGRANLARLEHKLRLEAPDVYGGTRRTPKTKEEMRIDLFERAINSPTIFEGAEPGAYVARLKAVWDAIDEILGIKKTPTAGGTGADRFRISRKTLTGSSE